MFRIKLVVTAIISFVLLAMFSQTAFAVVIPIESIDGIHLNLSPDLPEPVRRQIESSLKSDGCTCTGGSWTNARITLRYSGDTAAVNELLNQLARCPSITLSVSFKALNANCDWKVVNDTRNSGERLNVILNHQSPRIRLGELVIPPSKGPEFKPEP